MTITDNDGIRRNHDGNDDGNHSTRTNSGRERGQMSERDTGRFDRRQLFKYGGGAAAAMAGAGALARWKGGVLNPFSVQRADANVIPVPPSDTDIFIGGTDGWISLPKSPSIKSAAGVVVHPDTYAPAGQTTYIFGFRNITDLTNVQQSNQKNHAQHNAPIFWLPEVAAGDSTNFKISITNLGLAQRPDLFDAHTLHWHGFRNVIPFFDGEPTGSVSVPAGSLFTYAYRPRDPGTYMYHCHVEDVEHVQMGMTGLVFVHALQDATGAAGAPIARNKGGAASAPKGYAYNDGYALTNPLSTAYDREYSMFLSEVWSEAHWCDAHIQLPEWSDYHPDFSLLNGRVYPDTIAPNSPLDPAKNWNGKEPSYLPVATDANGDLLPPSGRSDLQWQPLSSLVTCNAGDRVLLRFASLGFKESTMTLAGIKMRVVGRDATPMRGLDPATGFRTGPGSNDTSYETNTLDIGPGESYDAIFTAPAHSGGTGSSGLGYDTYLLYNRNYKRSDNPAGLSGQATEIRVYPAGAVKPQTMPNQDELV